jgi:23S rRNA pseudouridine1911/1915/1917 synthase
VEEKIDFIVTPQDSGNRLDVVVTRHSGMSRSFAVKLIEEGSVLVDGSMKRPSFKVKTGMHLSGAFDNRDAVSTLVPCELPLEVLYEDDWIVIINKPAGLVVHPGAGNIGQTLVNALLARYPDIAGVGDPARPGIVHRLDKLTSGVMVAARRNESYASLSRAFKAHAHTREYLAICYGRMPEEQGIIETYMQRHPKDRKRMTSRAGEGRKAVTRYQVVRQWKEFSLLRLRLETGRTHQIRVHLSDMGHPVAGDAQYGGRRRTVSIRDKTVKSCMQALTRQMLHAAVLGITHPGTGEWMEFKAEMPEDMQELIKVLEERK